VGVLAGVAARNRPAACKAPAEVARQEASRTATSCTQFNGHANMQRSQFAPDSPSAVSDINPPTTQTKGARQGNHAGADTATSARPGRNRPTLALLAPPRCPSKTLCQRLRKGVGHHH
jgi:hypothetical protein